MNQMVSLFSLFIVDLLLVLCVARIVHGPVFVKNDKGE